MLACLACFRGQDRAGIVETLVNQSPIKTKVDVKDAAVLAHCSVSQPLLKASKEGGNAVLEVMKTPNKPSEAWLQGNNVDKHRTRVRALCLSIDAVLLPILDEVDKQVGGQPDKDEDTIEDTRVTWQDIRVEQLVGKVTEAGISLYGVSDFNPIAEALRSLLHGCYGLWGTLGLGSGKAEASVAESVFHSAALNRLLSMLAVIFCRRVTLESATELQKRASHWRRLCDALGFSETHLAVCLDPPSKALMVYLAAIANGERKITFQIRRGHAFTDAYAQATEKRILENITQPTSFKVFPVFFSDSRDGGDVAGSSAGMVAVEEGEGHGPRKEFFAMVGACLTGEEPADASSTSPPNMSPSRPKSTPALFTYNRTAGKYWFNLRLAHTAALEGAYRFCGWLMGQSMCNRSTLGLNLPPVLFQMLLEGPAFAPTMRMLLDFDPDTAMAIRNVDKLPDTEFRAMIEMEGYEGMTRAQYKRQAVEDILVGAIQWQMAALTQGFTKSLEMGLLKAWAVTPSDLSCMMLGSVTEDTDKIRVRDVFRVVLDDDLASNARVLAEELWRVIDAWERPLQTKFVHFVTGSSRLPVRNTEIMRVEIPFFPVTAQDYRDHLGMLPQAHTCENVLELPNYWEALLATSGVSEKQMSSEQSTGMLRRLHEVLEERLQLAVTQCAVYGLDDLPDSQPVPNFDDGGALGAAEGLDGLGLGSVSSGGGSDLRSTGARRPLAVLEEAGAPASGSGLRALARGEAQSSDRAGGAAASSSGQAVPKLSGNLRMEASELDVLDKPLKSPSTSSRVITGVTAPPPGQATVSPSDESSKAPVGGPLDFMGGMAGIPIGGFQTVTRNKEHREGDLPSLKRGSGGRPLDDVEGVHDIFGQTQLDSAREIAHSPTATRPQAQRAPVEINPAGVGEWLSSADTSDTWFLEKRMSSERLATPNPDFNQSGGGASGSKSGHLSTIISTHIPTPSRHPPTLDEMIAELDLT